MLVADVSRTSTSGDVVEVSRSRLAPLLQGAGVVAGDLGFHEAARGFAQHVVF